MRPKTAKIKKKKFQSRKRNAPNKVTKKSKKPKKYELERNWGKSTKPKRKVYGR